MPETNQIENISDITKVKSTTLEQWMIITAIAGKFFLAFGVISYVLGVLVVNLYLAKYGVIPLSLLKANYLLTGTLVLLPLLSWAFIIVIAILILKDEKKRIAYRATALLVVLCLIFGIWQLYYKGLMNLHVEIKLTEWIFFVIGALVAMLAIVMFVMQLATIVKIPNETDLKKGESNVLLWEHGKIHIVMSISMCMIFIPAYIYNFANNIYPKIPSCLGGAKPAKIQVFLDPNSEINSSFEKCKLSQINHGVWDGELILVTDSEYIFAVADANEALCIRKENIKAIKYYTQSLWYGRGGYGEGVYGH